jgi:hypothetical protein
MEEIKLWKIVSKNGEKPKAVPVGTVAKTTTERLLEDVLAATPDLLEPDLSLVGRQTETPSGPLDLLGVDGDGRLVVFELKRGCLTRDAVAQAIDYGSCLAGLDPEKLCSLISKNPGSGGIEPIDDFDHWYQSHFPGRQLADIGAPRIVLVGLGVDERAKRMVTFLAHSELDISLITFQGFEQGEEILFARQVEVQSRSESESGDKSKTRANQAKLTELLARLHIEQSYAALIAAVKQGLGESAYQSPNPSGYSFFLPEVSATGGPTIRSYIALYAPEIKHGKLQILLQSRAIEAAGEQNVKQAATAMGSVFVPKIGYGEIWIDSHEPVSKYSENLRALSQAIATGWRAKKESEAKAEALEVSSTPDETEPGPEAGTLAGLPDSSDEAVKSTE